MDRHGGGRTLLRRNIAASAQPPKRRLDRGLRKPGLDRQARQAGLDASAGAAGIVPKLEEHDEGRGRAVVADEVGQQSFHDVVVERRGFANHRYSRRWDA